MVWHFFKKDARLLWPLALTVVAIQVLCALRTTVMGFFDEPPVLERLTFFFPFLVYLGIAIVAVTAVHQEALCGPQEDWLIRPIRRRDLVLAKVLFVLLMVNVPLMVVDLVQQLALHFPLSVSIGVAFSRFLVTVVAFSLPGLVLGAVTRSLIDAFVFATCSAIGFIFLTMFATSALSPALFGIGGQVGMAWISVAAAGIVMIIGATIALAFQYVTRRTIVARGLGLVAVFAALSTLVLLPKTAVIAAQEAIWKPSGDSGVKLRFDAARRGAQIKADPAPGFGPPIPAVVVAARVAEQARTARQMEQIRLPLSVSGLPSGEVLYADRVAVRISSMAGTMIYQGAGVCLRGSMGWGVECRDNFLGIHSSTAEGPEIHSEQQLNIPIAVYNRIKDEPVQLDIIFALTRFAPRPSREMRAAGDLQALPEMGSCATRIDQDGDEVELGCLTNVGVPSCTAVVLEDPQTNKRNPELHVCTLSYGPFHRVAQEDAVGRSLLSIPFKDPSGLAQYPVDATAIGHARIIITAFDPIAHFHSVVSIANIRLSQWQMPNGY
jgi:hypothetical protein